MKASNSITITEINDGLGVSSVIVEYYKSTSPMETIGGSWSETVPERENGTYLWTRTTYVMSDGTTRSSGEACISGYDGINGTGISSVTDYYQVSPSNEVVPSTWVTDPSLVEMDDINKYLWNYTVINYDDGTTQETDPKVIGAHGTDGFIGENAQTYEIVLSSNVIKVSDTGTISPSSITCSFYHRDGASEREPYAGRYRIIGYDSSGTAVSTITATTNVSSVDIQPSSAVSYYQVTLYQADGTTVFLDSQTIPVLTDPAAYTVYLDNENHTFAGGVSAATAGQTVTVNVIAYRGTTRVATTIGTLPTITGLNATISQNGEENTSITFTTTSALSTAGVVSIPITVDNLSFEKDFSYSVAFKGETGTAARIHYLQLSTDVVKVSDKGVVSPSSVTVQAWQKIGSSTSKSSYSGRFQVVGYTSSGSSTTVVPLTSDQTSTSFNPVATYSYYIVTLYASSSSTNILDSQTIPVLTDESAYTVFLDNENHTFAGTATAAIPTTLDIRVYAYKGRTTVTPTIGRMSGIPTGMSIGGTTGSNVLTVTVTDVMTSPSGVITIPVTVDGIVFNKTFSYSIAFAGTDGYVTTIESTSVTYQASSSGTVTPTGEWSTDVPSVSEGQFLWTKTTVTYSDGNTTDSYSVGYTGINGHNGEPGNSVSIVSTSVKYQTSTSGTVTPTGTWQTTIPEVRLGDYLWTQTIVNYTGNVSTESYSVSRFGSDGKSGTPGSSNYIHIAYATSSSGDGFQRVWFSGATYLGVCTDENEEDSTDPSVYTWALIKGSDGIGITSHTVTYQYSSSGTTAPTGTWSSTVPSVQTQKYLWTRTVITYSDGNSSTSYSVSYIAKNGENGKSVTIASTSVMYATSSSGTAAPSSGWSSSIPSVGERDYLWTRTTVVYSDDDATTTESYSVSRIGADGPSGTPGVNSYLHIAYSTSADGQEHFQTTWFSGATYLGIYKDDIESDSQDYTKYNWNLMKGADGAPGEPGQNGVSMTGMVQHYQVSSSNTTAPTTWVDNPSQVTMTTTNKYLWSYSTVSYSNNTSEDTRPVVIGVYGNKGTEARIYMLLLSVDAVKVAKDGTITPGTITANSYSKSGTSTTKTAYSGRLQVVGYSSDGTTTVVYPPAGTTPTNVNTCSFTPSSDYVSYTVTLYAAGGTTNPLDSQTIPVITDGSDGASATAYTVYLTNEAHMFPGTATAATNSTTTTRVIAYKDTTQMPATIGTVNTQTTGLTATVQNNGKTNASILFTASTSLTTKSGVVNIPITVDGKSFTKQFSWSVAFNGVDGRGVVSVTPQYYLSTSDETATGGEWTTTQPQWQQGYYIWTRMEIVYTDSSTPVYTTEYCDDSLNQVITYVDENDKDLQDQISDQAAVIVDSETRITAIEEQTSSFVQTMEEIKSTVTTIGKDVNDMPTTISNMISHTSDEIALIKETTNENSKLREYIKVDGSKMTFGSSDSDVTLELDNDELAFKSGDTAVAYMSDQRMFITDATVDNELQIGGKWALYIRSNDHLTLKWIG